MRSTLIDRKEVILRLLQILTYLATNPKLLNTHKQSKTAILKNKEVEKTY